MLIPSSHRKYCSVKQSVFGCRCWRADSWITATAAHLCSTPIVIKTAANAAANAADNDDDYDVVEEIRTKGEEEYAVI